MSDKEQDFSCEIIGKGFQDAAHQSSLVLGQEVQEHWKILSAEEKHSVFQYLRIAAAINEQHLFAIDWNHQYAHLKYATLRKVAPNLCPDQGYEQGRITFATPELGADLTGNGRLGLTVNGNTVFIDLDQGASGSIRENR